MTEFKGVVVRGGAWTDGNLTSVVSEVYDEQGDRVEKTISNVGFPKTKYVYSFSGAGRPNGWKAYTEGDSAPVEVTTISYDGRGRKIMQETARADGSSHAIMTFSYLAEGRLAGEAIENSALPGLKNQIAYTYEGDWVHYVRRSGRGTETGKHISVYDGKGNVIREEQYRVAPSGEEVLSRKVTHGYDGRGFEIERLYQKEQSSLGSRAVYEYNQAGDLASATRYKEDGRFASRELFRYEYDASGNWVVRLRLYQSSEASEPVPSRLERRRITYF